MAIHLTPEDEHFRRNVVGFGGDLAAIARVYGVTPSAISHRLWSEKHADWWRTFKQRRTRRRSAARQQRYRERCRRGRDAGWGGPPDYAVAVQAPEDSWANELLRALLRPSIPEPLGDAEDREASQDEGVSSP